MLWWKAILFQVFQPDVQDLMAHLALIRMIGGSWLIRQFDEFAAAIGRRYCCIGGRHELTTRSPLRRSRNFLARRCINRRSQVLIFFWHSVFLLSAVFTFPLDSAHRHILSLCIALHAHIRYLPGDVLRRALWQLPGVRCQWGFENGWRMNIPYTGPIHPALLLLPAYSFHRIALLIPLQRAELLYFSARTQCPRCRLVLVRYGDYLALLAQVHGPALHSQPVRVCLRTENQASRHNPAAHRSSLLFFLRQFPDRMPHEALRLTSHEANPRSATGNTAPQRIVVLVHQEHERSMYVLLCFLVTLCQDLHKGMLL